MFRMNYSKISISLAYVSKRFWDHHLGEITPEDSAEKCLLEFKKIELKIEQRKLLGIKMSMTFDAIYMGRNKSRNKSSHGRNHTSSSGNKTCKYYGKSHNRGNCPPIQKIVKSAVGTIISSQYAEVVMVMINVNLVTPGQRRATWENVSMRYMRKKMYQWMT